jgi:hypothetical protein
MREGNQNIRTTLKKKRYDNNVIENTVYNKQRNITHKNMGFSEGFIRRMTEMPSFTVLKLSAEEEKEYDKLFGPTLTDEEKMDLFMMENDKPFKSKKLNRKCN